MDTDSIFSIAMRGKASFRNSLILSDYNLLSLIEKLEADSGKASYISTDGSFHFDLKHLKSAFTSLSRNEILALAFCLTKTKDIQLSERIGRLLRKMRSKQVTRYFLAQYPYCMIEQKQWIIYVLSSLGDYRCKALFEREWTNLELDRFTRCYAYEELASLYAKRKKRSMLIDLINRGLAQEPYLQLAALAKSSFLGETSFPESLAARMAAIPAIASEVSQKEDNWLFSMIRIRIQSDQANENPKSDFQPPA